MIAQSELIQNWDRIGLLAFLLIGVVYGGIKRWWVFGWAYDAKVEEAEEWKQLALKGTDTAELSAQVASRLTAVVSEAKGNG